MFGWIGTVLKVNLTSGTITKEPLNEQYVYDCIGQRGLAAKYHVEKCGGVNAFSLKNNLIFMTGPLTGTLGTCSGQFDTAAVSPVTGQIFSSSSGGHFGPEMKFAGYDGIIIEGKSADPVYLQICDGTARLFPAGELWGKSTEEASAFLCGQGGPGSRVCCIGPAGEKLSNLACIINDNSCIAGIGGLGAVMGAKKLKGIVVRGNGAIQVATPQKYLSSVLLSRGKLLAHPDAFRLGVRSINLLNDPYFSGEDTKCVLKKHKACFSCQIGCRYEAEIKEGPYTGAGEFIGAEAMHAMGQGCGIKSLDAIVHVNWLCLKYGIDPVAFGAASSCAMRLSELGVLSKDITGLDHALSFGSLSDLIELAELAGQCTGFGKAMALGISVLATTFGHPELADECISCDQSADEKKLLIACSSGLCRHCAGMLDISSLAEQLTLATGHNFSVDSLDTAAGRIATMYRRK